MTKQEIRNEYVSLYYQIGRVPSLAEIVQGTSITLDDIEKNWPAKDSLTSYAKMLHEYMVNAF